MGSNPVPAFLTKLWALVENPTCDDLICWDEVSYSLECNTLDAKQNELKFRFGSNKILFRIL